MKSVVPEKCGYSPTEAAKRLGVGKTSVYEGVRTGQIPARRLGGRIIIPKSWVDDFLMTSETQSSDPIEIEIQLIRSQMRMLQTRLDDLTERKLKR